MASSVGQCFSETSKIPANNKLLDKTEYQIYGELGRILFDRGFVHERTRPVCLPTPFPGQLATFCRNEQNEITKERIS